MIKRYVKLSLVYAILALIMGVFYREFTSLNGFEGYTTLSVIHTHYFMLGMFFFLVLALVEKSFCFSSRKSVTPFVIVYNIGLNITVVAFIMRGIAQVLGTQLGAFDGAISGIAGLGHTLLAISVVALLVNVLKTVKEQK